MTKLLSTCLATSLLLLGACKHQGRRNTLPDFGTPVPVNEYHAANFSWDAVDRVLVLPFRNESKNPRASEEVAENLRAELQLLGRFEVVATPPDAQAKLAEEIRFGGSFNEATMLDIARCTNATLILHGTITQYSPYPRPRLGLVIQVVDPKQGKVIGSVDGLWDSTDQGLANRIREYYRTNPYRGPIQRNNRIPPDDGFAGDLALDSPRLFQRYVCHEATEHLVPGGFVNGSGLPGQIMQTSATGVNSSAECNSKRCK
jgi:TolB-like protein